MPARFAGMVVVASLLLLAALPLGAWLAPEASARLLAKDDAAGGTGAVEHLTVLVLLPGIAAGAWAVLGRRVEHGPARAWVALWVLACVYFAGEEASWGQWSLGYRTPAPLAALNDQGEANLHNASSWLDQKPRALVELFILLAGVVGPLAHRAGWRHGPRSSGAPRWDDWVVAPSALLPAALPFVLVRCASWVASEDVLLGSSELRELTVAWFLAWYLAWFALRDAAGSRREGGLRGS